MKTFFTFKLIRFFAVSLVLVYFSLNLSGQTSHAVAVTDFAFTPKDLTITAGDEVVWTNSNGNHNVNGNKSTFSSNPESFGNNLGTNWTYKFVFNTAGTYNYQCDPHVGMGMVGKVVVNPKSSTGPFLLTVNFTGMTPHVGQTIWLAVIDQATKTELARVKKTAAVTFSIEVPGIETGKSYFVDFYADHNKNGVYNAPPADHAWRMPLNNVTGNSTLTFAHNTTFTDIAWKNKLTLHFTGMTPHLGQKISLFLKQTDTGLYKDTVIVPSVAGAIFDMVSWKIKPGISYRVDFYADHNKNGVYNAPPADHAWRINLNSVKGDTLINFVHNTAFTDIFSITSAQSLANNSGVTRLYPNPANQYVELSIPRNAVPVSSLKVYNIAGTLVSQKTYPGVETLRYDISTFKNGIYLMEVNTGSTKELLKFIKY